MAEHDEWTVADDEALRSSLSPLRREVDLLPLPDVRFVRARGRARHRRALAGGVAAGAAAVLLVGYVGFQDLHGQDRSLTPATSTRTGAPTATEGPSAAPPPSATAPTASSTGAVPSPRGSTTVGARGRVTVVGTRPLLHADLFVPPAHWSSPALTRGQRTADLAPDWEGSAAIGLCDVDVARDGTGAAGRFGIVTVKDTGSGTAVGKQRVRLTGSAAAAEREVSRLERGLQTCASRVPGVTVTAGPAADTAYRVDFKNPHGGPVITEWVAVTAQTTPGAVTTFTLNGGGVNPALTDGFGELHRLVALARQR